MKKRESLNKVRLSDSEREKLAGEIKAFYLDARGEEIVKNIRLIGIDLADSWLKIEAPKNVINVAYTKREEKDIVTVYSNTQNLSVPGQDKGEV